MTMAPLLQAISASLATKKTLPFSVYSSIHEQRILNVPIVKPLLIFVLGGEKHLGKPSEKICKSGEFIFLSNKIQIDMRNIPKHENYYALLIEFDLSDFKDINIRKKTQRTYCLGSITPELEKVLQQFIEWSCIAPPELWSSRRKELLQFLYHMGYDNIPSMVTHNKISHRVHEIISTNLAEDISINTLCSHLAMSESTLRRRLKSEKTGLQEIKDQARLGYGLHLLQSTMEPIGKIAEQCGYHSQSRFTDRFKQHFDITPRDLRKTRLND